MLSAIFAERSRAHASRVRRLAASLSEWMEGIMYKHVWTLLIAMGLSLIVATNAHADPIAALGARTPAIAIDPVLDRGMIVYEDGGRIYGKFVDNAGHGIDGDFLVLPVNPASNLKYKDPAIVFKTPQNRFYIAARQSFSSEFNLPSGPIVFDTADGIAVTAYDAAGTRLATRTLFTPGFLRNALTENAEARPAIAVDTIADASCCVAVAWEDARAPTQLHLMRLSPDLALFDAAPRAIATSAGNVTSLSATYNRRRDRFAFAYDGCSSPGRGCNTFITALPALLDGAERSLSLPERTLSTRSYGYPSIAYVPGSDRLLVSSGFATSATTTVAASRGVAAFSVVTASDGTMTEEPSRRLLSVTGSLVGSALPVVPRNRSQVIALGTQPRAMIVASSVTSDGRDRFVGYTIDIATMRVSRADAFSSAAAYIPTGGGAYSPSSGRVIGTWRQDTREASIWAFPVIP